jgi:hypothetical protein
MTFYESLQLDPYVLKQNIKQAKDTQEKSFFYKVLLLRDILLVAFATIFIGFITSFFGTVNASLAVVLFCILLSLRFVDFGYKISHSIISLATVFFILFMIPLISSIDALAIKWLINFIGILTIFMLTGSNPKMGNPGLYSFSYLFLVGTSQQLNINELKMRGILLFLSFLIFSIILFVKHKDKNRDISFISDFIGEDFFSKRNFWLTYYALGVSLILLFGEFIPLERFMWVTFAFSSLISGFEDDFVKERFIDRIIGVIIGSFLFGVLNQFIPAAVLAIMSGLALGLCSTYKYKSLFNYFGALSTASILLGLQSSINIRIIDNFIGLTLAYFYYIISKKLYTNYLYSNSKG